ncbi:MAG: hypothetical protein R6U94_02315 [Nitriliruptoraceae bacterium]
MDVDEGPRDAIRALLVAVIAVMGGGCGDADEVGAAGEEYEIINAFLREPDVVSVQVGSCNPVQRETVSEEDTEAVEVIDGTTGEPVEVHPSEDASIDR